MKRRPSVLQVVSATVMLAGLIAALVLCQRLISRERTELESTAANDVRQIAARLQSGILESIGPLDRLGRWWISQGRPADLDDWNTDGKLFLSNSRGIRTAYWIGTDGDLRWQATPGAPPRLHRRRPGTNLAQLAEAARVENSMVVSDVFDDADGTAAFYVCSPISVANRPKGYVIGLYDASSLIASLARDDVRPDQKITVTSGGHTIFNSRPQQSSGSGETKGASFLIGQRLWTVDLPLPLNYFREFRGLAFTVVLVIGALIYSFGTLLFLSHRRSEELQSSNAEIRGLNRDLNRKIAEFQTLLDVIPVGIAIAYDPSCRDIRGNPMLAKMLGASTDMNLSASGPDADRPGCRIYRDGREIPPEELPMQVAARTGKDVVGEEHRIQRADGTTVDVLSFCSPLFDESGRVRGVLNACVDISERKAQEQVRRDLQARLLRAQRMKSLGAMAAGIAHGFNNLLTAIIGEASLAASYLPEDSEASEHLAASLASAQQAATLVGKVLTYTGQAYRALRPTDLGAIVNQLYSQLAAQAMPKASVRLNIAPALPQVMAEPDEIRQVLHNLVLNAVEALPSGVSTIDIRVDCYQASGQERGFAPLGENFAPGPYVRIEVRDTGPGMPADIAERAFDPFFSTKFVGRGMGLSEVLGIMRAHKGSVNLQTNPASGTSVSLFFPAGERLGDSGESSAAEAHAHAGAFG